MSHFAKIVDGFVAQVIVAEQDVIDSGLFGDGWVQTSYNTHGNQHSLGGTPLRGNFAANGYIYDSLNDVFYTPKPYDSWSLNQSTWLWEAPVPKPTTGIHAWNEKTLSWVAVE